MSMLIATFEKSYGKRKSALTEHIRHEQYLTHAISFILITWDQPLVEDPDAPGLYLKEVPRNAFIQLFASGQNRWTILPRPFDPSLDVDPMLLFPGENPILHMATQQQLDNECSFKAAMDCLFLIIDADDRYAVVFSEYRKGHLLMKVLQPMRQDMLLSADMVLAKYTQVERRTRASIKTAENGVKGVKEATRKLDSAQLTLRAALAMHRVTETNVVHLVGVTRGISMRQLDEFMTMVMVLHFCLLALYGSTSGEDVVSTGNTIFMGVYCVEILMRIWIYKGVANFLADRRGQEYRMQANLTVFLAVFGIVVQILYYTTPVAQNKLFMGLSCLQLFRIFMTSYSFREITYCFVLGLPLVKVVLLLLAICIYAFTAVAYFLFQDVPDVEESLLGFSTLEDSWLAMFQIFIGSNWHSVMNHAVDHTNRSLVWFFVSYVLGVSVLFSNLFVGIMINMFGFGSDCCAEINGRPNTEGRVRLQMAVTLQRDLEDDECSDMVRDLGSIAEVLHFPPEWLCIETVQKFSIAIFKEGGVNNWAFRICLQGIQSMNRYKQAYRVRQLLKNDALRWIYDMDSNSAKRRNAGYLLVAVDKAFARAGIRVQDDIQSSDIVWRLIELACAQLRIVAHEKWVRAIRSDFERRFSGWMKRSVSRRLNMFDARHLHAYSGEPLHPDMLYDGALRPELVSLEHAYAAYNMTHNRSCVGLYDSLSFL